MQIKYFSTANNDIKSSEGSFKKILLLGLIGLIPIFGIIALYGYAFGWAREIAWGTRAPLPNRILENSDGKQYSRGFFAMLISFIFGIVPGIIYSIASGLIGFQIVDTMGGYTTSFGAAAGIGVLLCIVALVIAILASILANIGIMRMSIYTTLGSGLQFGKIWAMFKQDSGGAAKIFLMELLFGLIFGLVIGLLTSILFVAMALSADGSAVLNNPNPTDEQIIAFVFGFLGQAFLAIIAISYATMCFSSWLVLLTARAWGYWTSQFNVPAWRGSNDPMPFEDGYAAYGVNYGYGATQPGYFQQQPYGAQAQQTQPNYQQQAGTQYGYGAPQASAYPQQGGYPYATPSNYPDPTQAASQYPSPTAAATQYPTQAASVNPYVQATPIQQPEPATQADADDDPWASPLLGAAPATPAQILSEDAPAAAPEDDPDADTGEFPAVDADDAQGGDDFSGFGPDEFGPEQPK